MGDWVFDDRLRQLAEEYHQRCDDYDRLVCGNEEGQPTNGYQYHWVNRHAHGVLKQLEERQRLMGVEGDLFREIQRTGRKYE